MAVRLLQLFCGFVLLRHILLDFISVGVVISQRRIHLCQREMSDFLGDLFRAEAHLVPADDAPDRHPCSGNARTPTPDIWTAGDQCSDVWKGRGGHVMLLSPTNLC